MGFVPVSKGEPRKATEQRRYLKHLSELVTGVHLIHASFGAGHLT